MVIIAVILWAISSIGYKFAMGTSGTSERDPIASLAVRIIVVLFGVFVLSLLFGNLNGIWMLSREESIDYWAITLLSAILTLVGDITYFYALRFLDASRVYPLINTQTLFTFPFAVLFFNETIPQLLWIAALLMIIGVIFVGDPDKKDVGMEKLTPEQRKKNYQYGILMGIATGFFFGTQYLTLNMQNLIYYGIMENNFTRILVYAGIFWIYLFCTKKHLPKWKTPEDKSQFKLYFYTGLFGIASFGIGDAIYQIGALENGNSISIIIASSAPIFNQIFAILFLKEKFRWKFLIGVFCLVVGNIFVIF